MFLLMSFFKVNTSITYVVVGLIIAVIGGTIIEKLGMEKYIEDFVWSAQNADLESEEMTRKDRIEFSKGQVKEIFGQVWKYILLGVGVGAAIHNWIPQSFIEKILGSGNPFSVLIATFIGIPIYADIFGTIPIAEALVAKGVEIGTVLAFMMGVTALSLPSLVMLSKVVKPKLLATFVALVSIGIIIMGYSFNALAFLLV